MREWIHHYEALFVENRPKFVEISIYRKGLQPNESLQIIIEELRCGIKVMKNERSSRSGRISIEANKV